MDDDQWLLQALREETDRAVIGEFVQRHTQPADVRLVQHRADQRNPYESLEEAS